MHYKSYSFVINFCNCINLNMKEILDKKWASKNGKETEEKLDFES